MSYNNEAFPRYVRTAGKITVVTAITGLLVFLVAFMFDVGTQELSKASAAGTASTTLTVLNTPPSFVIPAYEATESSTSTPTNSGDAIVWEALGNDTNGAPYFLLVCSTNASPTANAAADIFSLGTAPPSCSPTSTVQWGVSAATPSDSIATVSTTTTEVAPFSALNTWYAWVCDDDPTNPRCNTVPVQGYDATNTSPFNVNKRPLFTGFGNDGPVDPGQNILFTSTSSDPDTNYDNKIFLVVCGSNSYSTTTNTCSADFLASTTANATDNATATRNLAAPIQDQNYFAYGFIVDEFGHEALANPINVNFAVNNVPPTVAGGDINLNGGLDIDSLIPGLESNPASTTLAFTISDDNSCVNASSTDEITGYVVSIFRSSLGTTSCDGSGANYDPNDCYESGAATTTWNLTCSATTVCVDSSQSSMDYSCTFPLWFLADPTDNAINIPAFLEADNWSAAVAGVDDDFATGTLATTTNPVEMNSFSALDVLSNAIVYGSIEPGNDSGTLNASSTIVNIGNTGIDQNVRGESMCNTFAVGNECPNLATSTIPEHEQQFSSTTLAYDPIGPLQAGLFELSSTTDTAVNLDVLKTTSTTSSSWQEGTTYWGIAVPAAITLSGTYTGLNTFSAVTAEAADWY